MARDAITITEIGPADAKAVTRGAVTAGNDNYLPTNDGKTVLVVHNADVGPHTMTVVAQVNEDGDTNTITQAIGAGEIVLVHPLRQADYNIRTPSADRGKVNVDFTTATSVTIGAVRFFGE
jgi:hypothetical protein